MPQANYAPQSGQQPQQYRTPSLNRSQLLAQLLSEGSQSGPAPPLAAGANALAQMLKAYGMKQYGDQLDAKEAAADERYQRGVNAVAGGAGLPTAPGFDGLGGPPAPGTEGMTSQFAAFLREMPREQGWDQLAGMMAPPKPGEAYTLTEGGQRYGANNQMLAENPKAPPVPPPTNYNQPFLPDGSPNAAFQDYQRGLREAGRAQTTVNNQIGSPKYGTVPPGAALIDDPNAPGGARVEYLEGSKERTEAVAAAEKLKGVTADKLRQNNVVLQDIGRAMDTVEKPGLLPVTGFGSGLAQRFRGTGATNLAEILRTVEANVGFAQLQKMRDASPTGGALGPVSDNENALLQSVLGSVKQAQNSEQLLFNLERLRQQYELTVFGSVRPRAGGAGAGSAPSGGAVVDFNDLP